MAQSSEGTAASADPETETPEEAPKRTGAEPPPERPIGQPQADATAKSSHFDEPDPDGDSAGTSADRRHTVAEALRMFGTCMSGVVIVGDKLEFNAPVTGGDYATTGARATPHLEAVVARTIAELAEVYVAPPDFARARELFDNGHRLLLLGTHARWGNTATAIRLLSDVPTVHQLRFADDLAALPVEDLPAGCGYVLDNTADGRTLATVRLQNLETLEDRLAKAGSRLVVITDIERSVGHSGRPMWRALVAPPSAYDVVLRRLRHRTGSADRAVELIDEAGVVEELRGTTADTFDIHRLVELASDLAEVVQGNCTLDEAVDRFANQATWAVEQWIDDEVTDRGDLALVLSLAVLNGMPYDAVSRWSTDLERRWAAEEPVGSAGGQGGRRRNRRTRLAAARARLATETWRTRYGPAPLEIASFVDGSYPQRVLRHYWHERDYDRELILEWLRAIGTDVEIRVATRAAIAVGYLGTFAFDTVRRDVIVPWVGSGKGDERELAVAALALPARSLDTASRAIRLVGEWSWRTGAAARMTAARALGASVGPVLNEGPDSALTRLAKGADGQLATALGDSVAELMVEAELPRQAELLGLLDAWSTEGRNGRQLAGVLGFLQVAWTLWKTADDTSWPTLLWLAELGRQDNESGPARRVREAVAALWSRALVAPGADNGVRIVLGSWADAAQRDPDLRPAFVSLFAEAAQSPRQAFLLSRHADRWRTRKPAAPDIARKLLEALNEGAVRHA